MNTVYIKKDSSVADINALIAQNPKDTLFQFEKSVYHAHENECVKKQLMLSNTDDTDFKNAALIVENAENIVLDFAGSFLECTGQVQPVTILSSSDVTVKNLSVDWSIMLTAESTVISTEENIIDVSIDKNLYPYKIENGSLTFWTGVCYEELIGMHTPFDKNTLCVTPDMGDKINIEKAEQLGDGNVRLTAKDPISLESGTILVIRHSPRVHAGMFAENCKNICFENINMYATAGLGILCQFNDTLTFKNVVFTANRAKGRKIINGHDDGLHLPNNRGHITIDHCSFNGLMDDPVNVHGVCTVIDQIIDEYTLMCRFKHDQSHGFELFAKEGDLCSIIAHKDMHVLDKIEVESYQLLSKSEFLIKFRQKLPIETLSGDAVENLTNTPSVDFKNSYFGSCRARGILVSTPGKVVIENNIFRTAGSPILLAGDANYWYESGACRDVTIRNNTFEQECVSSVYQFCKGIISVCPEVPEPDERYPFHSNIVIENNKFHMKDVPALYAFSAENLTFKDNVIYPFNGYEIDKNVKPVVLEYCRNCHISE